jgi:LysM repeat protein
MISRLIRLGTAIAIILLSVGKIGITIPDISTITKMVRTTAEQLPEKTEEILRTEPTDILPALTKLMERIASSADTDTAAPQPTEAQPAVTHVVEHGNTLYAIAKQYGVTVDAIRQANGLTSNDLSVGQHLYIP